MRSVAIVTLLACTAAWADDVPYVVDAGVTLPVTGPALVLPEASAIAVAQQHAACVGERDKLRETVKSDIQWWLPVVVGVIALGAGVSAGYAVSRATR